MAMIPVWCAATTFGTGVSVLPMSRGSGACAVARNLGVGFCRHAPSARRSVARFSRRVPRLRSADARNCAHGATHFPPRTHHLAREDARGPRRVAAHDRTRSRIGSGRPRGSTATSTPASSPARASRSRSPRMRCACTSSPTRSICRRRSLERLRDVLFYVVPRISPGRRRVRAAHRPDRALGAARRARRARHAALDPRRRRRRRARARDAHRRSRRRARRGARDFPACSSSARSRTTGPFYKVYPEGIDRALRRQARSRAPYFLGDNPIDLNRNFPWSWAPEHEQIGAGPFPASEPESRGIVEFATAHPEIFAWCNYHTFGGVLIRPPGHTPDAKMDQEDLALFRQLEAWMTELHRLPDGVAATTSSSTSPTSRSRGDLSEYAYNQRGALALRDRAVGPVQAARHGAAAEVRRSTTSAVSRDDLVKLAWWDRDENEGRVVPAVARRSITRSSARSRSAASIRASGCGTRRCTSSRRCARRQAQVFLRVAALAPRIQIDKRRRARARRRRRRASTFASINNGYLGTYGVPSAKKLDFNEPLYATARAASAASSSIRAPRTSNSATSTAGATACTPARTCRRIPARAARRTRRGRATSSAAHGVLEVRIGCARCGFVSTRIEL